VELGSWRSFNSPEEYWDAASGEDGQIMVGVSPNRDVTGIESQQPEIGKEAVVMIVKQ
jgi:hypothetical protein